jgi:hypothetical protein
MSPPSVMFPGRFNGPPDSANGGYACGVIAAQVPAGLVEVTLRHPPPLDTPLVVEQIGERYQVRPAGGEVVAVARPVDEPVDPVPTVSAIPADASPALGDDIHPFRTCFTCGPDRAPGDGLRIFAKRTARQGVLADHWIPDDSFGEQVPPEIVWAALDCPGGWAAFERIPGGVAVLGRMTARIDRVPRVGEPCLVVAASNWHDGRKIDAHSSLYTGDGELLAAARAVWIDVTA